MLTKIFHCDRDNELASVVAPKTDDQIPEGWSRLKVELPEGGYTFVFCPRCSGYLDEVLQAFGLPPLSRSKT